jgi:large repetitive protein
MIKKQYLIIKPILLMMSHLHKTNFKGFSTHKKTHAGPLSISTEMSGKRQGILLIIMTYLLSLFSNTQLSAQVSGRVFRGLGNGRIAFPRSIYKAFVALCLVLSTFSMYAQRACNSTAITVSTLDFQNPTFVSGSNNGSFDAGDVYRFPNVTTGVDALVSINTLTGGATLPNFDIAAVTEGVDGYDGAFQPTLRTNGGDPTSANFTFNFVVAGGTLANPVGLNFYASALDIDGNSGTIREYDEFTLPDYYIRNNPSSITFSSTASLLRGEATTSAVQPGTSTTPANAFTVYYENRTSFNYTVGTLGASASIDRLKALYFQNITYTTPVTNLLTGPLVCGNVSSTSGSGVSGVTINLTGASNQTTTTDALGNYSFTIAPANIGSYTITQVNLPNYLNISDVDGANDNIINGTVNFQSVVGRNFVDALDSDNDGIANSIDIDDDNDGILDKDEQLCSLSGTWTQISAGVWESPLASGYKTRVTLGNYNQFWDGASLPQNVTNFNRSCTGITSDFGNIINTSKPALQVTAGNASGSATNASFTVEFLNASNAPVFVQDPKFHLAGLGGSDGNFVTSSKWTLQSGNFDMLSSNGRITVNSNTFVHNNLTNNNGSPMSNCASGEAAATFEVIGNRSSFTFDVQMLNSFGNPGNSNVALDQFQLVFEDCIVLNTDGDGFANHLDNDSDGDNCSDAREAGATLVKTANYAFAAPYGANGLANAKETVADNGVINYALTYAAATNNAINVCNNVPTAQMDSFTIIKNQVVALPVLDNDQYGLDLPSVSTTTITINPAHGTAFVNGNGTPTNPADDFIQYTPTTGYVGTDNITYQICDLDGDCSTAVVNITIESTCDNILPNGGFEYRPESFTFPTNFEGVPSEGIAGNAPDSRFANNWNTAVEEATRKAWLLNDSANVVNNPQGNKFVYLKGQFDCAQFCNTTQPNCNWAALLGEPLINGMTYEVSFYVAAWNETISSAGAGFPTGAGVQGATSVVVDFDMTSGPQLTSPLMAVPASSSFTNLNWVRKTYTFTYNVANPVVTIYISQSGVGGVFLDNVKIRKSFSAGSDQLLCNVTNTTLATNPNVTAGTWISASGNPAGATFVAPTAGTTVVNGLVPGTYNFVKDINGCTDTVQIVNNPNANAGAGSTTTVSGLSTATINLADLLTGEDAGGTWSRATGTGGTFNATAGTFVPTNATNSTFIYSKTAILPCSTVTADAIVNTFYPPLANDDVVAMPLLEDGANGTVAILTNDTDPEGNPTAPTNGVGQFVVDMNPSVSGTDASYTNAAGVWTYNTATGVVTFDPANNFNGVATMSYELCDPLGLCDQATITFTVDADTDSDGIVNYIDIDDDNDGILDNTEGGQVCASTVAVSLNTKPYDFNEEINTSTTHSPVIVDSLIFGSLDFTASLVGAATWRTGGGIQIKDNSVPTVGHYIFVQPTNTNTSSILGANTDNYAKYELDFSTPLSGLSFISAGLNNEDTYEIHAFNGLTPVPLNATNLSGFSPSLGSDWTVYDLGDAMKVVGHSTLGNTNVDTNFFTTTIDQPITKIEIRAYKNQTSPPGSTNQVTTAITTLVYCTTGTSLDTDNDGTPNYLDSDSDNDTCSDALEAGATTDVTPNYAFTSAVGVNGFADSKETAVDNNIINYTATYNKAINDVIKVCIPSAPVATNDNETTAEDTPLNNSVATNPTDVDGNLNPNSFVTTDSPLHGSIVLNNNGTYTYSPILNFNGVDSVHYKVCDLGTPSLCDTATIIITITAVNDAPIASNVPATTIENTPLISTVVGSATDVDNNINPNGYTVTDAPLHGTIVMNPNGTFTYIPTANFSGVDSVHYQVCDLGTPALCATATVIITISNALDTDNDGIANNIDIDDDNDGITDIVEGDCLLKYNESFDSPLEVNINDNNIKGNTYNSLVTQNGANFNIVRVDGTGYGFGPDNAQNGNQYLDIAAASDYPLYAFTLAEPGIVSFSAYFSNRDRTSPGYQNWTGQVQILNSTGTTVLASGNALLFDNTISDELWFLSQANNISLPAGSYYFRSFVGNWGHLDNISICSSRDTDGDGIPNSLDLDSDGDTCSDALESGATTDVTANYAFTGTVGTNGLDNSKETAVDNGIINYTATYNKAINDVIKVCIPSAPVATNDNETTSEDTPLSNSVATNATDVDGDLNPNSFVAIDSPLHGSIVLNNDGTYTYSPTLNFNGVDSVHYKVCDLGAPSQCDTATIIVTITAVNDTPVASNQTNTTPESTLVNGTVAALASDVDGNLNPNSFTVVTTTPNGTFTLNATGTYSYLPNANFTGIDSVTYQVCDLGTPALCATAVIKINVTPICVGNAFLNNGFETGVNATTFPFAGGLGAIQDAGGNSIGNWAKETTLAEGDNYRINSAAALSGNNYAYLFSKAMPFPNTTDACIAQMDVPLSANTTYEFCVHAADAKADGLPSQLAFEVQELKADGSNSTSFHFNLKTLPENPNWSNTALTTIPWTEQCYTFTTNSLTSKAKIWLSAASINGTDTSFVAIDDACIHITNNPPVVVNEVETTTEDGSLSNSVATNATDADGNLNTNSFATTDAPLHGTIVLNTDGTYIYTPTLNFNGVDSVHYKVCDNGTPSLCDTATIIITVSSVNDAPIASNVPTATPEDAPLTSTVVGSSTDVDNNINPNGYTVTDAPVHGTIVMNPNGTFTYTPTTNFNGIDSVHYQVCDLGMPVLCSTATLVITISPVNDKPVAGDDYIATPQATPYMGVVTGNDTDIDNNLDPNSYVALDAPTRGTIVFNPNGSYTYSPNPTFSGLDSMHYRVCDLGTPTLCDTATIFLNVDFVNHNPIASNDVETTPEDTDLVNSVATNVTDEDNNLNPTSFVTIDAPLHGTIVLNPNGSYTYTPNLNFNGVDSVHYKVCDYLGLCDTATIIVTVTPVNDAPVATNVPVTTPEDAPLTSTVVGSSTDVDNNINPNGYTVTDAPVHGTIVMNPNGTFTYTPTGNFNGIDSVHYQVCDLGTPALCSTATLVITITPVNDFPLANTEGVVTMPEDAPAQTINVLTNDNFGGDGASLLPVVITKAPTRGIATVDNNGTPTNPTDDKVIYTPNANANGRDTLIYRIEDANGDFDTAVVYINITSVNDLPTANVDGITLPEDAPETTINVLVNDDFGGDGPIPSSITIIKQSVNGTASVDNNGTANNPTDDKILYTPDPDFNGVDSLIYRIGDANGNYDTAIVYITITPENDLPTADTEGVAILEDAATTSIDIISNDIFGGDGPSVKDVIITKASVNGVASVNDNGTPNDPTDDTIDYTPNANFNGLDSLIYRIEDANGDFDTAIVYITINAVNDKPVAGDDFTATPQAMPVSGVVTANDSDIDGNLDVNSFVMLDGPTQGSITFNPNGSYTYTPNPTFSGTDSVSYKVCDLSTPSLCDTAKVYFFVNFVNHNPIATNEVETTPEDVVLINSVATNVTDEDANLNPTSFVTIDAPLHGTIVLNPNGSYTYTPNANFNGVDSVHYQVCDFLGLCDTATIIVTVTSVNDAPIASNVPVTTPEDAPLTSTVVGSSTDVDNNINPLGYTVTDAPTKGTIVMNPNGTFTYTPNPNFNGIDSVHYQVCDLGMPILCSTATLVITVTSLNDLPLANTEGVTILEDAPATTITVLSNDDFGGDGSNTAAITITDAPSNGVASVDNNGTPTDPTDDKVIYTPNLNFNGRDTLIYRIEDANGDFDTAIVIIRITPVDDLPTAVRDIVSMDEDATLTGTVATNDFDVDGNLNPNSFTQTSLPTRGTITFNPNGSYTYTPTVGYFGTDSVEYQVCDLAGLCAKEWLIITINHVNHAPVATNDVVNATEDTPLNNSVATNATDVDGDLDPNSFVAIDAPTNGTIVINPNGTYTYTPNANFNGVDSVHYKVCDLSAPSLCDTATIIITVLPVNDKPVATNDVVVATEDTPLNDSVVTNATDVDSNIDPNSFVTIDAPTHGTIVLNPNGSYTYTPNANFNGVDSVHYKVCDLGTPSMCDTATIIITVSPVNDKPVTTNDVVTTSEDMPLNDSVASNPTDVDNNIDPNSFVTIDAPTRVTIVMNPDGTYTYTPNANFNGVDSVHYKVCDLGTPTMCDTATIIITITPVNDAPIATVDIFNTNEEVQVSGTVVLNDSDIDNNKDNNSHAQVDAPKNGTMVLDPNGNFTYNPMPNFFGIDTMSYRVCDLGTPALCDTALIIVNVSNVNDAPRANVDEGMVLVNGSTNVVILSNDTDADGVLTNVNTTITIDEAPKHGVASVNPDGTILYTPNTDYVGKDTLIYKLCDNGTPQLCDTAIVFISISATNNAPIANVDGITIPEDTTVVSIPVLTNDADDQILTASNISITDAPNHGTAVINPNGTIGYTPNANYNGRDTLIYRVCDNGTPALCDTAIVFIDVTALPNDAPVAVNDTIAGPEDLVITNTVATNDTDKDSNLNPTSFVTIDMPTHGTIVMNPNGSYTYTPSNNFNGVDSVHYKVCDTKGGCDTATLIITITPVNDKPLAVDDAIATTMDSPVGSTLATNDFDIDGNLDPNSFVKIGDVLHGTITINPTGSYNYIPTIGYVGKDSVQYQVCDLAGSCDTAWLVITVTPIGAMNQAPVATEELVLTNVNTPANGTLTSKVSDPDGNLDNNSFAVVGTPKNGTITISATGSYIYTPNNNFVGEDSVQYRICDLGTPKLCDTSWVLIVVEQPNRAPIALDDNVTTAMNNTYTGTLTTKVSDPDSNLNPNSFTQIGNATNGSMTINPNGTYSFIPTIGFVGKDSVQYRVCDLGTPSLCDTAWIVVTILDAKPIAIDDAYTTDKNTTVGFKVTTNDDAKGTVTTVNVITQPKNGSLNFVGIDSIRFTPFNGYCGTDTFTYSLCNQFGLCDTAQVVVTMNCVALPIAPVALDDIASTNKNTPVQIAMLDNDTTNGTLTKIEVITNPTRGTAVVQGNNILYTPATDSCGKNDTLTYRICTANGCDTAQIIVSVNCGTVNNNANKPVAVDDAYTTDKGVSVTFKATLNDTLNGTLTGMNVIVDPRHGSILFRSPDTLIYTPQLGYCGKDTLTYVILNNKGLSDTADIVITITCTPDVATALPVAVRDVTTTPKNKPVTVAVLTNDTLNGTLTKPIIVITQPKRGTATVVNNDIVYTPQTGQCGYVDTVVYEICNIQGCSTAEVIVSVACPTTLPIAIDDNYVTNLNTSINFSPLKNDTVNGVLKSLNIIATAKHGTVGAIGTDSLTYNPATGYCGIDTIQYSITRDDNEVDTAFIYITINCGAKPDAINDVATTVENAPKSINVLGNDATNGPLTKPVTVVKQPTQGTFTVDASNNIIYTPNKDACGFKDTLTYEICTAAGCDTAEVVVTVDCIAKPDARDDVATTKKNLAVDIDILNNDAINGILDSFKVVTQPTLGTATIVGGKLRYVPKADTCNYNDTLTYRICNQNACDTATVIVTVTCDTIVKVAPVANVDFGKTPKSTPIAINVLANDSLYSQVLDSITITQQPKNGSVVVTTTNEVLYTPNATFCGGNDTLIYKICTAVGCDTALVVINVACDTPTVLPVANVDIDSTTRGMEIAIDVTFNDELNGADTIRIVKAPKYGTASIDVDKFLIYQPDSIFCGGTDSLIYEICNLRGCDTALVLIHVKCDSIGLLSPIAFDDSATTQIDSAIVITILDNDILKGGTLQDSLVSKPRHGSVIFNNGAAFYMPNPGYWGLDTFEYAICNINGCDTARVIIKIDAGSNLTVFNGFSPDGDGMNDYFSIRGIENYPNNDVILWNRWGNQVGSIKGYNNADKAWDGTWNGKLVPDGTYFYIINFNDGVTKPVAGYVQIHR